MVAMIKAEWLAAKDEAKRAARALAAPLVAPLAAVPLAAPREAPAASRGSDDGLPPTVAAAPPAPRAPVYEPGLLVRLRHVPLHVSFRHLRDVAQVPGRPRYVDCPAVFNNGVVDARALGAAARAGHVPGAAFPSGPAPSGGSSSSSSSSSPAAGTTSALVRYFTADEAAAAVAHFSSAPVLLGGSRLSAERVGGEDEAAYWVTIAEQQRAYLQRRSGSGAS